MKVLEQMIIAVLSKIYSGGSIKNRNGEREINGRKST